VVFAQAALSKDGVCNSYVYFLNDDGETKWGLAVTCNVNTVK
jgi:hypothetical protein